MWPPPNVDPNQWNRLVTHFQSTVAKLKSEQMFAARASQKNPTQARRKGHAQVAEQLKKDKRVSPSKAKVRAEVRNSKMSDMSDALKQGTSIFEGLTQITTRLEKVESHVPGMGFQLSKWLDIVEVNVVTLIQTQATLIQTHETNFKKLMEAISTLKSSTKVSGDIPPSVSMIELMRSVSQSPTQGVGGGAPPAITTLPEQPKKANTVIPPLVKTRAKEQTQLGCNQVP